MGTGDGLGWGMGGQIVKQIRRGGGNEQEVKKTEKGRGGEKSSTETMQTEMAGLHSRPGTSFVLLGSLIRCPGDRAKQNGGAQ